MSYSPLSQLKGVLDSIQDYLSRLNTLADAKGVLNDIRVTPTGAITANPASGTITTVTTVSTLTNQGSMGGYAANNQIPSLMNMEATIANIDNIIIS